MAQTPAWEQLADLLLQREALICRAIGEVPASSTAGLYVTDDDAIRILRDLPGLRDPKVEAIDVIDASVGPDLVRARAALVDELPDSPLGRVQQRFGLSSSEIELLAVIVAVEIEHSRQFITGYIQDDLTRPRLMRSTLRRLHIDSLDLGVLHPDSRLVSSRLIHLTAGEPWGRSQLRPSPSLVWAMSVDQPPPLPTGCSWRSADMPRSETEKFSPDQDARVWLLYGRASVRAKQRALNEHVPGSVLWIEEAWLERVLGGQAVFSMLGEDRSAAEQLDDILASASVSGASLAVDLTTSITKDLRSLIEQTPDHRWVLFIPEVAALNEHPSGPVSEVDVEEPLASEVSIQAALDSSTPTGHRLSETDVEEIVRWRSSHDEATDPSQAIARLVGRGLHGLAEPRPVRRSRSDLILTGDNGDRLDELIERYRYRSLAAPQTTNGLSGITALFAGPSGTGKTLAAEVVAHELGLTLHRVDLSSMLSKYIGESEKQLARLFDAALHLPTVLFFDEADAVFGKRSEVKDSHDRYANAGVSYLLQRVEQHEGLIVLASNLSKNIDEAFRRRIHVTIEFPLPDVPQREQMWRQVLPSAQQVHEADFVDIARRYELTGAAIRNAALTATFRALGQSQPLKRSHLDHGIRRELQKLGRLQPLPGPPAPQEENRASATR